MAEEPELTGLDSNLETATPSGTVGGTREEASLGAIGSSGAGRRIDLSGRDPKSMTK